METLFYFIMKYWYDNFISFNTFNPPPPKVRYYLHVQKISLILLVDHVTGSEAMFADLCYFPLRSVQVMSDVTVTDPVSILLSVYSQLIYWWNWWWFVCSLHLYFLFYRAYCWVIWVKLHTLCKTMQMLVMPFILPFQVSINIFSFCTTVVYHCFQWHVFALYRIFM